MFIYVIPITKYVLYNKLLIHNVYNNLDPDLLKYDTILFMYDTIDEY